MSSNDLTVFVPRDEEDLLAQAVSAGRAKRRSRRRRRAGMAGVSALAAAAAVVVVLAVAGPGPGVPGSATGRDAVAPGERSRVVSLVVGRALGVEVPPRMVVNGTVGSQVPEPVVAPALRQQYPSWMPLLQGGLEAFEGRNPAAGPATVLTLEGARHQELPVGGAVFGVDTLQGEVRDGTGRTWAASLLDFGAGRGGDVVLVGDCGAAPPPDATAGPVRQACAGVRIEFRTDFVPQSATVAVFAAERTLQWVGVSPAAP